MIDHYKRLGVDRDASTSDIRHAYRQHVKRLQHVRARTESIDDEDAAELRAITEAHELLIDEARRARYDRELAAREASPPPPPPPRQPPGGDLLAWITLPLRLALLGGTHVHNFTRPGQPTIPVRLTVPAGVRVGDRWRIAGEGRPGDPPGDLIVELAALSADIDFWLEGGELHTRADVTLADAYAGAHVVVDAPRGAVTMRLPGGQVPPPTIRLPGQGWPIGESFGDLVVHVSLRWPPPGDVQLLEALRRSYRTEA